MYLILLYNVLYVTPTNILVNIQICNFIYYLYTIQFLFHILCTVLFNKLFSSYGSQLLRDYLVYIH